MPPDLLLALAAFALVSALTPGPNNVMLLASGVNFGFRSTVPHMLGISIGHAVMVIVVGLGLAGVLVAWPPAGQALKLLSTAYLLWLAWKIATAAPTDPDLRPGRPLTFLQAALFQWVNPKAWTMTLGAVSVYAPGQDLKTVLIVAGVFILTGIPAITIWAGLGTGLSRLLAHPRWLRRFNLTMAALLVATLWPVLAGDG